MKYFANATLSLFLTTLIYISVFSDMLIHAPNVVFGIEAWRETVRDDINGPSLQPIVILVTI